MDPQTTFRALSHIYKDNEINTMHQALSAVIHADQHHGILAIIRRKEFSPANGLLISLEGSGTIESLICCRSSTWLDHATECCLFHRLVLPDICISGHDILGIALSDLE